MFKCRHCEVSSPALEWDKATATTFIGKESDIDMIASIEKQEQDTIHICPNCKEDIIVGEVVR